MHQKQGLGLLGFRIVGALGIEKRSFGFGVKARSSEIRAEDHGLSIRFRAFGIYVFVL